MAEMRPRGTLYIMAKAPVAGAVKTRLARAIGAIEALRFYRAATSRLLQRVGFDPRWRTVLAVTPDTKRRAQCWPSDVMRVAQGRGDLGRRMQRLLDTAPRGPVVIVGSDIPGIRRRHIAQAFTVLGAHEVVFGPADDGGYWLVGARRRPRTPRLFAGVRWSSEHALSDTALNAKGEIGWLETLPDVDEERDWLAWRRKEGA